MTGSPRVEAWQRRGAMQTLAGHRIFVRTSVRDGGRRALARLIGYMTQRRQHRELVPEPDVVVLEGVGHYPQLEDPGRVVDAYAAFRARIRSPRDCTDR